jgi:ribosome-associated translation inhibitor RaiA
MGAFTVHVTLVASGHDLVVSRTNNDVMVAINEVFDTMRRNVKEAHDKLRGI